MLTNVYIKIDRVYGKKVAYPSGDNARKLIMLMGKKTFSLNDLNIIGSMGFDVRVLSVDGVSDFAYSPSFLIKED